MAIQDNEYGLKDVQEKLLLLTKEVLKTCQEENIPYTALAGTMLGAVREKGMIPWDDDVDLVFTHEALERLILALPKHSSLCEINQTDTWVTRAVFRDQSLGNEFVDLFQLVPVYQNPTRQKLRILRLKLLQGMLKRNVQYERFSTLRKIQLFITGLMGKCLPRNWVLKRYRRLAADAESCDPNRLFIPDGPFAFLKAVYPAQVMKNFTLMPFEDTEISVSTEYDAMLKMFYGDTYMQRPPEKDRHSTHDAQR